MFRIAESTNFPVQMQPCQQGTTCNLQSQRPAQGNFISSYLGPALAVEVWIGLSVCGSLSDRAISLFKGLPFHHDRKVHLTSSEDNSLCGDHYELIAQNHLAEDRATL